MEFFFQPDWFNRPGPYAFTLEHFMFILLAILIGVGLSLLLRKKSKRTIRIVLICLWALAVSVEVIYYIVIWTRCAIDPEYTFKIDKMLPFHSCLMFMYIFPIAIFAKNKIIYKMANNFMVIVNMIIGFITLFVGCPGDGYSVFSYQGMTTLVYHALIFIVPLIMVITNYYDLEKYDFKYGLAMFGILSVAMWTFDAIARCDYFYFYDGHTFPVFKFMSENVPHIVWTLIVVSCYVITAIATHFLIYGIKYYIQHRKQK